MKQLPRRVFTVGHSTRSMEDFLRILKHYGIGKVVDVRRFPTSKKFPWFCKENLREFLEKEGIEYYHLEELGGYRKEGYEAFSKSEEFEKGIRKLLEICSGNDSCVILCSEFKWWKCHRRYIARKLASLGIEVVHILTLERAQVHKLGDEEVERKMKTTLPCDKRAKKLLKKG